MSIQKAKASVERVREIKKASPTTMLEYQRRVRAEVSKINDDRRLSPEGKEEAKQAVKKALAVEFLQKSLLLRSV